MFNYKLKNLKYFFFLILLIILVYLFYFFSNKFQKESKIIHEPISINLLTSVHPKLLWNFQPLISQISVNPGEVITVEYMVENIGSKETTTASLDRAAYREKQPTLAPISQKVSPAGILSIQSIVSGSFVSMVLARIHVSRVGVT